jgi:hypothetical protein
MNIRDLFASLFEVEPRNGALVEERDYRTINLGSFQKPVGAAALANVAGLTALVNEMNLFYDQKKTSSCVGHAIAGLMRLKVKERTGITINPSPRFLYKRAKQRDGIPDVPGTFPRVGAILACKEGFPSEYLVPNATELGEKKYLDFTITENIFRDADGCRFPGFAEVDPTIDAIKEAIHQNGAVVGSTRVGRWTKLPLRWTKNGGHHYTVWYAVERIGNDHRVYVLNSWGAGWLGKVKKWLFPGRGYFMWSEYENEVRDIIAFTEIPKDLLEKAKARPFKFVTPLYAGMSHPHVAELQKFLNSSGFPVTEIGVGSRDEETSFFGVMTRQAVVQWQLSKGLPTTGYFGPMSIQEANRRIPKMTLEDAIIEVESGGDLNAIGDKHISEADGGWAYGPMQIRQPAVTDVNRKLGTNYKATDCLGNLELSLKIFHAYCEMYVGKDASDEIKARLWNGGLGGVRNPKRTDIYWSKVSALLN